MPIISVIVPIYNSERYLCDCINSILKQSFSSFELVLIDDGSTDNSGRICDDYSLKDERIKVIHQENQGVGAARNMGIQVAQGEYIVFVDSDDCIHSEYLFIAHSTATEYNADIVIVQFERFTEFENLPIYYKISPGVNEIRLLNNMQTLEELCLDGKKVSVTNGAKLFKRELFDNMKYPVNLKYDDWGLIPILMYKSKIIAVSNEKIYYYRDTDGSITNAAFSIKNYDLIDTFDICIDFFDENKEEQLVKLFSELRNSKIATYSLEARKLGIYKDVPKKYKISEYRAFKYLENRMSYYEFSYFLSLYHPKLVKMYEYIRKIKKTLGISVPA